MVWCIHVHCAHRNMYAYSNPNYQGPIISTISNPRDVVVLTDHPSKHLISSADLDIGIISLGVKNLKS